MGREYDDGIPIRRHTKTSQFKPPVAVVAGGVAVLVLVLIGAVVAFSAGAWTPGSDTWTTRDLVDHLNSRAGDKKFKIYNSEGVTFITDDLNGYETAVTPDFLRLHEDYLKVGRFQSSEEARIAIGSHAADTSWQWNQFTFYPIRENADRGVSKRVKGILRR